MGHSSIPARVLKVLTTAHENLLMYGWCQDSYALNPNRTPSNNWRQPSPKGLCLTAAIKRAAWMLDYEDVTAIHAGHILQDVLRGRMEEDDRRDDSCLDTFNDLPGMKREEILELIETMLPAGAYVDHV